MPELALIERITRGTTVRPGTDLGIGDDAALVRLGDPAVASHDMLVEDVHFRRATTSWRDLGAKALAVNVSDIAAMGAVPVAALVGLGLPGDVGEDAVAELYAGMEEVAAEFGMTVAGGDVTAAPVLVIGVTALGRPQEAVAPLRRSGGRPGDLLCVTGPLGAAAAGLLLLERPALAPGLREREALVGAHRRPRPQVAAGLTLAGGGARALMDVSDGLALDARRLALACGLRARIDLGALPLAAGVAEVAGAAGEDATTFALTGGEDHGLLAAVPPDRVAPLRGALGALHVVGSLREGEPGVELVGPGGPVALPARLGWEHGA